MYVYTYVVMYGCSIHYQCGEDTRTTLSPSLSQIDTRRGEKELNGGGGVKILRLPFFFFAFVLFPLFITHIFGAKRFSRFLRASCSKDSFTYRTHVVEPIAQRDHIVFGTPNWMKFICCMLRCVREQFVV